MEDLERDRISIEDVGFSRRLAHLGCALIALIGAVPESWRKIGLQGNRRGSWALPSRSSRSSRGEGKDNFEPSSLVIRSQYGIDGRLPVVQRF
jgi:hypothetical protein